MGSSRESILFGPDADDPAATSRNLLDQIKAGDAQAWYRLVDLYAPLVYRWCRALGLPSQDVADIVQEVFRAVSEHVGEFRKERVGDTFRGWLRTITRNKVRDHLRRLLHEPRGTGGTDAQIRFSRVPGEPSGDDYVDIGAEESSLLRGALEIVRDGFENRTWTAFWETTVEGRAVADVGAALNMTPGAVRVAKARVLRRLREELGAF